MNAAAFPKITIILRGYEKRQIRNVIEILTESTIKAVEITMNTPGALEMIETFQREFKDQILIGAGTVNTLQQAEAAIQAGARFILSPIVLPKAVINLCKANSVISVSGAMTPTEIYQGLEAGADIVKVFPAISCGARFFKDVKAPLGNIPLMAVGGITKNNAKEFLNLGADYLGIGSGIFNREDIINGNLKGLRGSLKAFEAEIG
ncbi:bifunctional 4-hydroxy-2-oxoglutarate aldolase/2-dehydro-3-deoxy-phosphogluconate aldolase [Alkaliphilus crotonatoxidans]